MKYFSYKTVTLIQSLCNHLIPVKILRENVKLLSGLAVFCLLCISNYTYSNYIIVNAAVRYDPQVPVEVTGKIIINPPVCASGEKYDKNLDECVQKNRGKVDDNKTGNGEPKDNNSHVTSASIESPSMKFVANHTDVETKVGGQKIPYQHIVIVNDALSNNSQSLRGTVQALTNIVENLGAEIVYRYNSSLTGFTFNAPNQKITDNIVAVLSADPRVKFIEQDKTVVPFSEELPTGLERIDAGKLYTIHKMSSFSANVDIAIIDSGIDLDNPDLNVYSNISMVIPQLSEPHLSQSISGDSNSIVNKNIDIQKLGLDIKSTNGNIRTLNPPFTANPSSSSDDYCGHGTHVAGIAAAKANSLGVVGVAPGARLWAIKVLDYNKLTGQCEGSISSIIAAIEYVTKLKDKIEVVNLSLGCKCNSTALDDAINRAVKSNITIVVAAGNINSDASKFSPANNKDVIAVSAITDLDGKCGGLSKPKWINAGQYSGLYGDDTFSRFSNYGKVVDIAAPGVMINSTDMNGSYSTSSGTSMAAPHVAGAAALYKILHPESTPSEIRNGLITEGVKSTVVCDGDRHGYFKKDPDHISEPLLSIDDLVKNINAKINNVASRGEDMP